MSQPRIDVTSIRPAVRSDASLSLDVLVTVSAPEVAAATRPPLNLGLVLDRSGSMGGRNKMAHAREAAVFAVQQLRATDRASITVFDEHVETIAPNAMAENKARLATLVRSVDPRGSTDLHGGWSEGVKQVGSHRLPDGVNRVILLSDGLANHGETSPDAICGHVTRARHEGVATTTMGVGDDYNEDLLEAMARAGDGNYYYIASPVQLTDIFQSELKELIATFGSAVSLGVEPAEGVAVEQVLNEYDVLETGRYKLPNLVAGMPVQTVVRLTVPPRSGETDVCRFRVAWEAPGVAERQVMTVLLELPSVDGETWDRLAPDVTVEEQVALLKVARAKREATRCSERGDRLGTMAYIAESRDLLAAARPSATIQAEALDLAAVEALLDEEDEEGFRKTAKYQSHRRSHSRPT
jgi:Ca-activated chloride channel family protein